MMIEPNEIDYSQFASNEEQGVPSDLIEHPELYEEQLPLLRQTVLLTHQYQRGNTKARRNLVNQHLLSLQQTQDLTQFEHTINNLDLIESAKPDDTVPIVREGLLEGVEKVVGRNFDSRLWTPDRIGELTRWGLDSNSRIASVVERIKTALFNSPRTIEEGVDCLYNTAWAMMLTQNPDIRAELYAILCYQRNCFRPDSDTAVLYNISSFLGDDDYIRRHNAVENAVENMGTYGSLHDKNSDIDSSNIQSRFMGDLYSSISFTSGNNKSLETYLYREYMKREGRVLRMQQYANSLMSNQSRSTRKIEITQSVSPDEFVSAARKVIEDRNNRKNLPWPENLFQDPIEPLNQYIYEIFLPEVQRTLVENSISDGIEHGIYQINSSPIPIGTDLELNVVARNVKSEEQANQIVRDVYESVRTESTANSQMAEQKDISGLHELAQGGSFIMSPYSKDRDVVFFLTKKPPEEEMGRLSSLIEYHRPIISIEQANHMLEQLQMTRESLRTEFVRSPGKRGYNIPIVDPALRELGYENLFFKQDNQENFQVTVAIAGETFSFSLDRNYRSLFEDDVRKYQTFQDQVWLELLTLSHLKPLMCTNEDKLQQELLGEERQYTGYKKQLVSRGEYLRKLPSGQVYSERAFQLCLQSRLPNKNLLEINRQRGATKETGMWTYVSGVDVVDTPDTKPVKLALKNGAEDLRKVLALRQVSDEELQRMEDFILTELI